MTQIPISGAYAKILYAYEDVYGIPIGGSFDVDSLRSIDKVLGHGITINSWSKDNGLKTVVGINNVEPSAIVDGPFNGSISIEFDPTADLSWMKSVMGTEEVRSTTRKGYTKFLSPPSISFLIYLGNDSVTPTTGELFLLTGVVVSSVTVNADTGDKPVHVSMDCNFKTEYKYESASLAQFNSPTDLPFNYSMVNAYFWNPGADINLPSSFDSMECTIEALNFTIRHAATLIRGIGTRVAKDKVHANIEYDLTIKAVFKDPRKYLERFYGCVNTPSKYIAPYEQIKVVIENFFRDSRHAKVTFAFKNIKIKTHNLPLQIENVIYDDMTLVPISCDIEVERGCPATPSVYVSPALVEAGKQLYISGSNFAPGETVTLHSTLLGADVTTTANCLGELFYSMVVPTNQTSGIYDVEVYSETSIPSANRKHFEVTALSTADLLPSISMCKSVLSDSDEQVTITGFNFTGSGNVALTLEKYNLSSGNWDDLALTWSSEVLEASVTDGMFTYSSGTVGAISTGGTGKFRVKAKRGALVGTYQLYVPEITTAQIETGSEILTFNGAYFPTMANVTLKYQAGTTELSLGAYAVSSTGYLPGPTSTDTMQYVRASDFPTTGTRTLTVTIAGVNGGSFAVTKTVTLL